MRRAAAKSGGVKGDVVNRATVILLGAFLAALLVLSFAVSVRGQELGDVNGDGSIDIVDALQVARYDAGLNPSPFHENVADVNGDGSIDIVDALTIARYDAGLITEFPGAGAGENYFIKENMPDLGQHSPNWCWTAAAANSLYWYSQHGYPQLIDDPTDPTPNDNRYITDPLRPCHCLVCPGYYRLLDEIALDCNHGFWEGILDNEYFYGLQKFIDEQGAPLIVHEIVDNNMVMSVPPEDGIKVIYRPPTLRDYKRELENCQDVLLWLNYRHENYENYESNEETDHVVTGVGFGYDNKWIIVSDPWTPGSPDHGNSLLHENNPYDNLLVISLENEPLWVLYDNRPVYVSKMVYISPAVPAENFIKENMPDLGQHCDNWCWAAAAANSFKWYAHHGYPKLLDDPSDSVLDENYLQLLPPSPGDPLNDNFLRLLHEIAVDCLYPGLPDNSIGPENTWCHPVNDNQFFYGLREFIREQGVPLYVHEIFNPDNFPAGTIPENDGENVIYDNVTFDNYKRELENCHDVLLQLPFRNYDYESGAFEALDHIVTGVSYYDGGPGKQWIEVSDPWTPLMGPDHNNDENRYTYENLPVVNVNPLTVTYTGWTPGGPMAVNVQVVKLIFISP